MPTASNSTPVITGDRLFVNAEPTALLCINIGTGEILWQSSNSVADLDATEGAAPLADADTEELQRQLKGARHNMNRMRRRVRRSDDPTLKEQLAALQQQVAALTEQVKDHVGYDMPTSHGSNGYSSCTPVTDGTFIYALFGNGVAACYTVDGQRQWIRMVDEPTHRWGHSSSPVLVENTLVILINGHLHGLDTNSGEPQWQIESDQRFGTPIHAHFQGQDAVVTPSGQIVAVANGDVLASSLGNLEYCTPVLHEQVLYFIEGTSRAIQLPIDDAEPKEVWKQKVKGSRHYASPVIHHGLVYTISREEKMTVLDAKSGEIVYQRELDLGGNKPNSAYPSVTLAGDFLFFSSESGQTIVVQPGREYVEVSRNKLERFRASPVFRGNRLYIRGLEHLYCIGSTP